MRNVITILCFTFTICIGSAGFIFAQSNQQKTVLLSCSGERDFAFFTADQVYKNRPKAIIDATIKVDLENKIVTLNTRMKSAGALVVDEPIQWETVENITIYKIVKETDSFLSLKRNLFQRADGYSSFTKKGKYVELIVADNDVATGTLGRFNGNLTITTQHYKTIKNANQEKLTDLRVGWNLKLKCQNAKKLF
jgi:hypothetical protein